MGGEFKMDLELERGALVALLRPPHDFKWAPLRNELLEEDVLPSMILEGRAKSGSAADVKEAVKHAQKLIEGWEATGARFLTYLDEQYPRQLREVHDLPPFIFTRGRLLPPSVTEHGISIVGSREASAEGLRDAAALAERLAARRISVVSGLAAGIDSAAHTAALRVGGRTIGVIGTGIDRFYPKSSEYLQLEIERRDGLVLSQFWPGTGPTRYNFPMRNVVMSAFSSATVIVEASEKSGTKHQAHRAIAHGRPLILSAGVASGTSWGRKLSSDPARLDVSVVHSVEQAAEVAEEKSRPIFAVNPDRGKVAWGW